MATREAHIAHDAAPANHPLRDGAIVLLTALAARAAFLLVKPASVFSDDVKGWRTVAEYMRHGRNPYETSYLNWPSIWPGIVWVLDGVSRHTGVGFVPLLWSFLIAVELVVIAVTFGTLCQFTRTAIARNLCLAGLSLNPTAIFQTTQHGNFDVLLSLAILLGVTHLMKFNAKQTPSHWLGAAAWLGIGCATKTVPLCLAPLMCAGVSRISIRMRIAGFILSFGPLVLLLGFVYWLGPAAAKRYVFSYRSSGQSFGISGLLTMAHIDRPQAWIASAFTVGLAAALGTIAWRLYRRSRCEPKQITLLAALILLSLPTFGPGFGTQYVYWYLPLLLLTWPLYSDRSWRRLLVIAGVVYAGTYVFEYSFQPILGNLGPRLLPGSDRIFAISIAWSDRSSVTLERLPLFATDLALLIAGTRLLLQKSDDPQHAHEISVARQPMGHDGIDRTQRRDVADRNMHRGRM